MSDIPFNHRRVSMDDREDDPQRAAFLDKLAAEKGRAPFTLQEVLATPSPIFENKNLPQKPRRRR